ncbi:MAG: Snf7 family protein [Candidatus Bathyarchaeota archaeon]|nr:MAG: Snf7 family protein [Candidatus Bathyarchaeota archaeon]
MLDRFFQSPPPLEEMIPKAIRKLKIQHVKLERVIVRLRQRDHVLFKRCTIAVENENRERAIIFANELAEIRRLMGMITRTQIVIECVILRLETVKELNTIVIDLKPVVGVLRSVTRGLDTAMPEVASELDQVGEAINETLATTQISSPPAVIPLQKTPESEEILAEVSSLLGEELATRLPAPPVSVIVAEGPKQVEEVRQAVALAASCSEAYEQRDSQDYVCKDMELQRLSFRIERPVSIEDRVLEYAKRCQGKFDVAQCAVELNASSRDVEEALESLGAEGKIKMKLEVGDQS